MTSLFRQQAIDHQNNKLFGDVVLIRPLSFALLTTLFTLIVTIAVSFLLYGKYGRKEVVAGYIVPDKGLINVYAPYFGIAEPLDLHEGKIVKAGEVLYRVSTDLRKNEQTSDNEKLLKNMSEQESNLEKTINLEKQRFSNETTLLDDKIKSLSIDIKQLKSQAKIANNDLALAKKLRDKYRRLRKTKLILESELTQHEYAYSSKQSALKQINQYLTDKENELNFVTLQIEQLPTKKSIRMQDLEYQLLTLQQKMTSTDSHLAYDIVSPVEGTISSIIAEKGQKIDSNMPLLTLSPLDSLLQAELFLPSRSIGFIEVGQAVKMRYEAFPYQRYGLANGTIKEIAQTIINPQEIHLTVATKEPVYRVKVTLDKQSIAANGKTVNLQSGMLLSADILLEKRSLFEWLLEPIYSLRGRL